MEGQVSGDTGHSGSVKTCPEQGQGGSVKTRPKRAGHLAKLYELSKILMGLRKS